MHFMPTVFIPTTNIGYPPDWRHQLAVAVHDLDRRGVVLSRISTSTSGYSVARRRHGLGRDPLLQARIGLHQRLLLLESVRRRRRRRGHPPRQRPAAQLRRLCRRRRADDVGGPRTRRSCRHRSISASETTCSCGACSPGRAVSFRSGSSTSRTSATIRPPTAGGASPCSSCKRCSAATTSSPFQYGRGGGTGFGTLARFYYPDFSLRHDPERDRGCGSSTCSPFSRSTGWAGRSAGVYQHDTNYLGSPGLTTNWYSAGGRAAVAFAKHGKLLGEAGYDRASRSRRDPQYLAKFTGAIALTADRGFLSRPELRLFYTWAVGTTAATAGVDSGKHLLHDIHQRAERLDLRRASRDLVVAWFQPARAVSGRAGLLFVVSPASAQSAGDGKGVRRRDRRRRSAARACLGVSRLRRDQLHDRCRKEARCSRRSPRRTPPPCTCAVTSCSTPATVRRP